MAIATGIAGRGSIPAEKEAATITSRMLDAMASARAELLAYVFIGIARYLASLLLQEMFS
ncbi:hypothetical protein ATY81_11580 [Rhizobium sp. R72]|nr:hypothetical protein ATY81_11580 [Rhizobium sp. R72]OWV95175.1 hypothetical protein ATY80_11580 [Rhizobium sp. R711]